MMGAITNPPPPVGDNSRHFDIERTIAEVREMYLRANIHPNTSYKWRVLYAANASDMSNVAFRRLFTDLSYAEPDGTNATQSHRTVALLTGQSVRSCERAADELESSGWQTVKRRRRETSIKAMVIPQSRMDAILFELLEPSKMADQELRPDKNGGSRPAQEPTKMTVQDFRTDENVALPLVVVVVEEESKHTQFSPCEHSPAGQPQGEDAFITRNGQARSADKPDSPELELIGGFAESSIPSEDHVRRFAGIAVSFNVAADIPIPPLSHALLQKVKSAFKGEIQNALRSAPRDLVLRALESSLASASLKDHDPQYRSGPKPAFGYWCKTFRGELERLRAAEHRARVEAETVQTKAEIEVNIIKRQGEIRVKGTETRTEGWNAAAAAKRIAPPVRATEQGGPARFRNDGKPVIQFAGHWVGYEDANRILDAVPGATVDTVKQALFEISDRFQSSHAPQVIGGKRPVSPKAVHDAAIRYLTNAKENPLLVRDPDMPDNDWHFKLRRLLEQGRITQEEAKSAGLKEYGRPGR